MFRDSNSRGQTVLVWTNTSRRTFQDSYDANNASTTKEAEPNGKKTHAGIQKPKCWTQDGWTSEVMDSHKVMVRPDTTFFVTALSMFECKMR